MIKQFEVGKIYATRSICDHDTIYSFMILSRTAKTVTINVRGKVARRGLSVYDGVEQFKPHGNYSMCAIISADKAMSPFDGAPKAEPVAQARTPIDAPSYHRAPPALTFGEC